MYENWLLLIDNYKGECKQYKGLGSLTINFCPANMEKNIYKELQNITMVTKYNLFTVNKWIFTALNCILYLKNLTFSYALMSK